MAFEAQDVVRVSARLSLPGGQDLVNVYHFALQQVAPGGDDDVLADIVERVDNMHGNYQANLSNDVDFQDITVYIEGKDDSFPPQAWPVKTNGADTGENLPAGVAMLCLLSTGKKRVVGRKYMGGFTEAVWSDGDWTQGVKDQLEIMMGAFATVVTLTNGTEMVGGIWSAATTTFNLITGVRIQAGARYQRRRRLGAGS